MLLVDEFEELLMVSSKLIEYAKNVRLDLSLTSHLNDETIGVKRLFLGTYQCHFILVGRNCRVSTFLPHTKLPMWDSKLRHQSGRHCCLPLSHRSLVLHGYQGRGTLTGIF